MDTKIIQQYGQDILCYQIKSKRSKIRDQKKGEEKRLIRLNREWGQINDKQRNLGYVDLHPPIVRGWKRYFILREDVARSRHAVFYQKILDKINTEQFSHRKDFKKKKRKGGKKNWVVREQRLLELNECGFAKMKFDEKEITLFDERYELQGSGRYKKLVKFLVFKEPWRFVLRVRPNLITKVKAVDVELERRSKEIQDYLDWNGKGGMFGRLINGSHKSGWGTYDKKWCGKPIPKYQFKQQSLQQLLNEEWYKQ
jgi:hypothetical protein